MNYWLWRIPSGNVMKDEGGDSACPSFQPLLSRAIIMFNCRGLSHYEGSIIRRGKNLPERSGFFISYEKWIFWIFQEIVSITIGMNTTAPKGHPGSGLSC